MKHEELIMRLEVSCLGLDAVDPLRLLVDDVVAALAQPEQKQQIETLKRCLFQMQEAAKDLVEQAKSLTPPQRTEQLKACVYCGQLVRKEKNT